jgi:hypothetical protein
MNEVLQAAGSGGLLALALSWAYSLVAGFGGFALYGRVRQSTAGRGPDVDQDAGARFLDLPTTGSAVGGGRLRRQLARAGPVEVDNVSFVAV